MAFGRIRTRHGKPEPKTSQALFDSGGSGTVINHNFTKKLKTKSLTSTVWRTAAGNFETKQKAKIQSILPELHENKLIEWIAHVTEQKRFRQGSCLWPHKCVTERLLPNSEL
jgi:hypothetical protein